jgi:NUMOD4 motif/HNH endonuclease
LTSTKNLPKGIGGIYMETWKRIADYEDTYEISNYGSVRNIKTGRVLKLDTKPNGYLSARLCKNSKVKTFLVHRLVAIHFIPNPDNKPVVNHDDGVKTNNHVSNLVWSTSSENTRHAIRTGLKNEEKRIANVKKAKTKITPEQKQWIKDNYIPANEEFGSKALAEKFGVTRMYISQIANSK